MTRDEIIQQILQNHISFLEFIQSLNDNQFIEPVKDKWTAGQQLLHIYIAVKPLVQALQLPPFLLRLLFGKANRPSRTYDALVNRYKEKLANGGRASGRFVPGIVDINKKEELTKKLQHAVNKLSSLVSHFKEKDLDELILPHPLLGKITLREMMYFTIYHVEHHHLITKRNLSSTR